MAAPALCRAFSQNAWRRDLCSNCFRSKEEHKAAAAARQKSPTEAARLAGTAAVKGILKCSIKSSSNSVGKKSRIGVSFHKEESQVIGYGGDDEIHSADEEGETEEVESANEEDLEREKAEQQALERLTKANTDFNSVIANLQIENISQEKQITGKGSPSGIPVLGGRSAYTGPLRLGLGSKDNDGNKKTLLVSVRPFGSAGDEVSKPPTKTKITVTNGYGSGVALNGNSIESKDCSKATVNGSMTNGFGYSSVLSSKEISVKVSVSSNGVESKSTVIANGSTWKSSSTVNGSNMSKVNGSSDAPLVKNKIVNGHSKQMDVKLNDAGSKSEVNGVLPEILSTQNDKVNNVATMSKAGVPVPASRMSISKEPVNEESTRSSASKEDMSNGDGILCSSGSLTENGFEEIVAQKMCIVKEEMVTQMVEFSKEESRKVIVEEIFSSSDLTQGISNSAAEVCGKDNVSGSNVEKNRQIPVPAERAIPSSREIFSSEEKPLSESNTNSETARGEMDMRCEKELKTENTVVSSIKDSKVSMSVEENSKKVKETISTSLSEGKLTSNETKCNNSEVIGFSQVSPSQSLNKIVKNRSEGSKQETTHSKCSEDNAVTGKKFSFIKTSSNSVATGAQKIPAVTKRPAPSILKMGVPVGWNSKSLSQKNLTPNITEMGGKGSSEEKISCERANIVNGILKTQPPTTAPVGPEKPLKPVNTIAKLRANFVNNNLKIIAESAAKIVNGTRYSGKNSLADEIPISKSSVMNLSMRPIPTNNIPNKRFANEDNDSKGQATKGLHNIEKVSNSSSSLAKVIGPDIRELLRTPEKEKEEITFTNPITNKKNNADTKISDGMTGHMKASENVQEFHEDANAKLVHCDKTEGCRNEGEMPTVAASKDLSTFQVASNLDRNKMVKELEVANRTHNEENVSTLSKSYMKESVSFTDEQENHSKEESTSSAASYESKLVSQAEGKPAVCDQMDDTNVSSQVLEGLAEGDSKASADEESPKKESPAKGESVQEKPSPNEKTRKKGIVRRILLKGGNEIYRKAGEMVRSVRRGNESKDELESVRETEIEKEDKGLNVCNQVETLEESNDLKDVASDQQSETVTKAGEPELSISAVVCIEEAISPAVSVQVQECTHVMAASNQEKTSAIKSFKEENLILKDEIVSPSDDVKVLPVLKAEPEKQVNVVKPRPALPGGTHPPIMSPRPSFLHSKVNAGQPWSVQSPSCNAAGSPNHDLASVISTRSERAVSMSSISSVKGVNAPLGQRSRLSSLPASEAEMRASPPVATAPVIQPTLRKPGPIISGVKPAIPAKPNKVLEASSVRQQHNRPAGERKASVSTMGTPGSVGRSAGKRQAPKPPGMDGPQRRESSSSESTCSQKEIGIERILACSGNQLDRNQTEKSGDCKHESFMEVNVEVQHSKVEENERNIVISKFDIKQETEIIERMSQDHNQALGLNGEDLAREDSVYPPRGTHFVKNQALNASKSSSRVARETERRQMLLQMQSNHLRGPVPYPQDNSDIGISAVPDLLPQMPSNSLTPLSSRQRSASLGRGVGVATPRPPLLGGSLGRTAGEGAVLSIASVDMENIDHTAANPTDHEEVPSAVVTPMIPSSNLITALTCESSNLENAEIRLRTNSPVRSRSEGSLAMHLVETSIDNPGAADVDTPVGKTPIRGQDMIAESPSSVNMSCKKKRHTVRGFLKFLRRGSLRDDSCGAGGDSREETIGECEPKARPVIVHPLELDGACVEVVKGGGVDVRRRLEEESAGIMASEMATKLSESAGGTGLFLPNEQSQNTPRRPTSIPLAPPRPPPVLHSPSSPSLSSSSSSSTGSTPVRPKPPPPPRGMAPVPPSPGGSGQKPARPPPPKPAHLLRLGLVDRGIPAGAAKSSGDGIYANLGEVRATLTPCKPQRTASMREVILATPGKGPEEARTPRITPRNLQISGGDAETSMPTLKNSTNHSISIPNSQSETVYHSASYALTNTSASKRILNSEVKSCTENSGAVKCDKLSWSVGVQVLPNITTPGVSGALVSCLAMHSGGTDSSSEEENVSAPPLPLVPPPSPPPPLPLNPPPSPPSHATSSSASSSLANPLILPEDSGYESVEFHAVHDSEVAGGRWWGEGGIAASRGSVVTTTTDSLEESYEAVVGANHRALADVLAQVCQPNPEEFGSCTPLQWSDFLVEGPKGGILRSVGPVSFHRAAMKGKGAASGGDSWRRVTLGVSHLSGKDLPQFFRGCACHDGGNTPVGRCTPSLKSLCTFHDNIPIRFFSSASGVNGDAADLIQATVMVFNPLHLYSLKTYLIDLMSERKTTQRFPPLPEESNWCNRACLFLLVLLDTLCALDWCGREDALCVIREEARPGATLTEGDGEVADGVLPICPLPRLCIFPNVFHSRVDSQSSPTLCFQSVVTQILEGIHGDAGTDSFVHALQCIVGIQGNEDALSRSRAALELWLFGPPLLHSVASHVSSDRMQEELGEARDMSRWTTKNPILSLSETEPTSIEGELSHAAPRRWLDLERAGALRSLAVSALHRGGRIPLPVESGLENSAGEEGIGLVGKCCRGWRVGEIAGNPSLPNCEEVRLRFLVGTSGSEVAEAWELLARMDPSVHMSINLLRTSADISNKKLASWSITNDQAHREAHC